MAPPDPGAASPPAAPSATRAVGARVLVVLAAVVAALALVAGYVRAVRRSTPTSSPTAPRRRCSDDSVRSLVAERITDEVVLKNESRPARRAPAHRVGRSAIVGGRAFASLFRSAVRDVHRAVFDARPGHGHADESPTSATVLARRAADAAALARRAGRRDAAASSSSSATSASVGGDLARLADDVRFLALLLLVATLAARGRSAGALADRRRTVVELGVGAAARRASSLSSPTASRARSRSTRSTARRPAPRRARSGTRSSATCARRLGSSPASGAVVAAAAASLIRPVDIGEPLRRAAGWLGRRAAAARRCGRCAALALRRGRASLVIVAAATRSLRSPSTLVGRLPRSTRA